MACNFEFCGILNINIVLYINMYIYIYVYLYVIYIYDMIYYCNTQLIYIYITGKVETFGNSCRCEK